MGRGESCNASSRPARPLPGRQDVPRYCARVAVRSDDVSCERRLSGCLYRQVEGEGGMEREKGGEAK